ncbi:MAG: ABC transporter ATP-binding protein [Labilithrix sp.]|nr:ABC transporter ATP-binding protein [Labilithrix sp.]
MSGEAGAPDVLAVCVQNVVKRVRDGSTRRTVLDDVSFDVKRGELVIVRGPSGSGKTTLLAIVGAMLSPTSGEVHLDGEPTSRLREAHRAEIRRRKVGFVFQDLQLIDGLTALRNVLLPCVPDGVTSADEARARALLEQRGLGALADSKAKGLSGGERQRVALCRALLNDPKLLVLDEPTAHLDDANAIAIAEELASLAREGRALLVATHDARIAASAGVSRVLDLAGGKVVGQGPEASSAAIG